MDENDVVAPEGEEVVAPVEGEETAPEAAPAGEDAAV